MEFKVRCDNIQSGNSKEWDLTLSENIFKLRAGNLICRGGGNDALSIRIRQGILIGDVDPKIQQIH